jgi:hypothetical protein
MHFGFIVGARSDADRFVAEVAPIQVDIMIRSDATEMPGAGG